MEQAIKEINEKLKTCLNKLPFHAKYWRFEKKCKNKNELICFEYNTRNYILPDLDKPISYIPNVRK